MPVPTVVRMTNRRTPRPTDLTTAVAPVRQRHGPLLDAALAWAAGRQRATPPELFALVCAAAEHSHDATVTPTRWTRVSAYHVLRCDVPNWCSVQRCAWPDSVPEAMWAWFDFLLDSGRLDPRSDPVAELRKPLACAGWLDQTGDPLPPDARREIECECFLPYRETAELLGELVRRCETDGSDPLQVLRGALGQPSGTWSLSGP